MNLSAFVHDNAVVLGPLATAAGTALVFITKQWWEERKERRTFEADQQIKDQLINLIRDDLKDRKESEQRTGATLTSFAKSLEGLVLSMGHQNATIKDMHGDLTDLRIHIQGSNGASL